MIGLSFGVLIQTVDDDGFLHVMSSCIIRYLIIKNGIFNYLSYLEHVALLFNYVIHLQV